MCQVFSPWHYLHKRLFDIIWLKRFRYIPVDTKPELNLLKTFTYLSGCRMKALCTINLDSVSTDCFFFVSWKNLILSDKIFCRITFCVYYFYKFGGLLANLQRFMSLKFVLFSSPWKYIDSKFCWVRDSAWF